MIRYFTLWTVTKWRCDFQAFSAASDDIPNTHMSDQWFFIWQVAHLILSIARLMGKYLKGDCLAIRTFQSTSLFEIKKKIGSPPELLERAILESSDTGDRPVMDVKINSSPMAGILVNDQGVVYRCDFGSGWKSVSVALEYSWLHCY